MSGQLEVIAIVEMHLKGHNKLEVLRYKWLAHNFLELHCKVSTGSCEISLLTTVYTTLNNQVLEHDLRLQIRPRF